MPQAKIDETNDDAAEEAALDAFDAGFDNDTTFEMEPDDSSLQEDLGHEEDAAHDDLEADLTGSVLVDDDDEPAAEEEHPDADEPVPSDLAAQVEELKQTTKRQAGRIATLQSLYDRSSNVESTDNPVVDARPSPDLIRQAVSDTDAYKRLAEGWPETVALVDALTDIVGQRMDEMHDSVIDAQEERVAQVETQVLDREDMQVIAALDARHKDWQDTAVSDEFKAHVFDGGPSVREQARYELLIEEQRNDDADSYYESLLEKYPDWADNRGRLYGTNSADAALQLLDSFEKSKEEAQEAVERSGRQRRLRGNVPPTKGRQIPQQTNQQTLAEAEFDKGFAGQ